MTEIQKEMFPHEDLALEKPAGPKVLDSLPSANAAHIADIREWMEHLKQEHRDSADSYDYLHKRFNSICIQINKLEKRTQGLLEQVEVFQKVAEDFRARFGELHNCKCGAKINPDQVKCRTCGKVQ